jgi:hypothetical protein
MLAAVATVAGLVAAPPGAAVAVPRSAGCSQLRQRQHAVVTLVWRYRVELSRVDNGRLTVHKLDDQTHPFGRMVIAGATCQRPGGLWQVIDPVAVGYTSTGLDGAGNLRSSGLMRGWGIGIRSGAGGSAARMALQIMHCGKGNFFRTLKTVIGVPVPGLPFTASVAKWAAGRLLPSDKQTCGDVGVKPLRVYASSSGALRVADLNPWGANETEVDAANAGTGGWTTRRSYDVLPIAVT